MNILFYIEPLIETGRPYWKEGWATYFSANIIKTLNTSSLAQKVRFSIAVNEPVNQMLNFEEDIKRVIFTQSELLQPFDWSYLNASLSWYKEDFTPYQLEYYIKLMQDKFEDFIPDIIITFSPAPFFRKTFTEALVLHMEYSIFSRAPYPQSWYLDPVGMLSKSYINKFKANIENTSLTNEEIELLKAFKERCQQLIRTKSPFKDIIATEKTKYDYLLLLPLQFSGYYGFDGNTSLQSQYEYLTYVIENIPSNIGLIVTTHPDYPLLDNATIQYLKRKYSNFIFHEEFENYHAASQYLIEGVDAVITVSSSVGLQTLLWDKKLITIGECFKFISDADGIRQIKELLDKDNANKDNVLFWLLSNYAIPEMYFRDPEWFSNFLQVSLNKYRESGVNENFYNKIDENDRLFQNLSFSLDENIPKPLISKSVSVQLRQREKEIEGIRLKLEECSQEVLGRDRQLSELNQLLSERDRLIAERDEHVTQSNKWLAEWKQELKQKSGELVELEGRYRDKCHEVISRDQEIIWLEEEVHQRDERIRQINDKYVGLEQRFKDKSQEMLAKDQELLSLAEERSRERERLGSEISQRDELVKQVSDKLAGVEKEYGAKCHEIQAKEQELSKLAEELSSERERRDEEIRQRDEQIRQYEDKCQELQAKDEDLSKLSAAADAERQRLQEEIVRIDVQYRLKSEELDASERLSAEAKENYLAVTEELRQKSDELSRKNTDLAELDTRFQSAVRDVAAKDEQLRRTTNELAESERQCAEAKGNYQIVVEELSRASTQAAELQRRLAEADDRLRQANYELDGVREALEARSRKVMAKEQELRALATELREKDELVQKMLESKSWKITAPLRAAYGIVKKRK